MNLSLLHLLVLMLLQSVMGLKASKVVVETFTNDQQNCPIPDTNKYVEYHPSSGLAVILSAPHGGLLEPKDIPDRNAGCWNETSSSCIWHHECGVKNFTKCKAITEPDIYTRDLTLELLPVLCELFHGACPGVIINLLDRDKFDANRDRDEATFNVPEVVEAFEVYHCLIEHEQSRIGGRGLFIDIHGHGHKLQRAELGYLVSGKVLDNGTAIDPNKTSIRSLAERSGVDFDLLLRGNVSFGGFLESYGFESVPSPRNPGPGAGNIYFNGGYNTRRHGSLTGGSVDAIQIESPRSFRELPLRRRYALALGCTIKRYICAYYWNGTSDQRGVCAKEDKVCLAISAASKCCINKILSILFIVFCLLSVFIRRPE